MKAKYIVALCLALVLSGCATNGSIRDTLYQISTINALLDGVYQGSETCGDLLARGDFGIGTFDALDGEMAVVDGAMYRIRADGGVDRITDFDETTPFASITFFDVDKTIETREPLDYEGLKALMDSQLSSPNYFYAVRVRGKFDYVKTRSVPRQKAPYPKLLSIAATQPIFEFNDEPGVLIGFYCPEYVEGVNVPGWHLHFLTDDRAGGGHLLECRFRRARIDLDETRGFTMNLPESMAFRHANISGDTSASISGVEK